jgi:hypothetical protein
MLQEAPIGPCGRLVHVCGAGEQDNGCVGRQMSTPLLSAMRASPVPAAEAKTGSHYSRWTLSDLAGHTVTLFLFGDAHKEHYKESEGGVFIVRAAKVRAAGALVESLDTSHTAHSGVDSRDLCAAVQSCQPLPHSASPLYLCTVRVRSRLRSGVPPAGRCRWSAQRTCSAWVSRLTSLTAWATSR